MLNQVVEVGQVLGLVHFAISLLELALFAALALLTGLEFQSLVPLLPLVLGKGRDKGQNDEANRDCNKLI
jgi:hypothetical protein